MRQGWFFCLLFWKHRVIKGMKRSEDYHSILELKYVTQCQRGRFEVKSFCVSPDQQLKHTQKQFKLINHSP